MANLQDLISATQGMTPMPGATPAPGGADIVQQLQQLLQSGGSNRNRYSEPGMTVDGEYPGMSAPGQANMGAYLNANKAPPGNPMLDAIATAMPGAPRSPQHLSVLNSVPDKMAGSRASLGGDQDYYDINEANQNVRGNLPKPYNPDYTGFSDDMMPYEDKRQTPDPKGGYGKYNENDDGRNEPPVGFNPKGATPASDTVRGQLDKQMSTEQELEMTRKNMGKSGDPSEDGNFPTNKEIIDLQQGKIDPAQFDAKWGKGAAKEMMSQDTDDEEGSPTSKDMYDGDHEYR